MFFVKIIIEHAPNTIIENFATKLETLEGHSEVI